jgi:hypothetical protein
VRTRSEKSRQQPRCTYRRLVQQNLPGADINNDFRSPPYPNLTGRHEVGPALPKDEPVHQFIPLVEFAFDTPRGEKTAASMNPGLAYGGQFGTFATISARTRSAGARYPRRMTEGKADLMQAGDAAPARSRSAAPSQLSFALPSVPTCVRVLGGPGLIKMKLRKPVFCGPKRWSR